MAHVEVRSHQLPDGTWEPSAVVWEDLGDGVSEHEVPMPDKTFPTKEEADQVSGLAAYTYARQLGLVQDEEV
jgi:hypothetical protein